MPTLHLGVMDQPYQRYSRGMTTYGVAQILEDHYDLMQTFWDRNAKKYANEMATGMGNALDELLEGRAVDPFGRAMGSIRAGFDRFITLGIAERSGIPGTPTKAALRGVNHRFKHPYAKHPRRVSFRDTGQYVNSFRAWVT